MLFDNASECEFRAFGTDGRLWIMIPGLHAGFYVCEDYIVMRSTELDRPSSMEEIMYICQIP
jgi:hypothetical protein